MNFQSLTLSVHQRVALVEFTTPELLNSLTETRFAELEAVLDRVEADGDLSALVLWGGEGKSFCVGLDLDLLDRAFDDLPYFEQVVRRLARLIERIEALPIPTLAAVNGFARAGGFELALGCDFMIVADEARLGDVHTDAGVLPAASSLRLKRRIGEQRAKEVIWTARWYQGAEAMAAGLALRSVPRAQLRAEALAFAASIADKPRATIAANKAVFQQGVDAGVREGAELELRHFMAYLQNQPYGREGYRAYREGRQPAWKSKG